VLATVGVARRADALVTFTGTLTFAGQGPIPFRVLLEPGVSARFESAIGGGNIAASQSGASVSGTLIFDNPGMAPCNFTATIAGPQVQGVLDPASCGGPGSFQLTQGAAPSGGRATLTVSKQAGNANGDDYTVNGARPTNCGNLCAAGEDQFGPFPIGTRVTIAANSFARITGACSGRGSCSFTIRGNARATVKFN
jgi:hypothetical protein